MAGFPVQPPDACFCEDAHSQPLQFAGQKRYHGTITVREPERARSILPLGSSFRFGKSMNANSVGGRRVKPLNVIESQLLCLIVNAPCLINERAKVLVGRSGVE